MDDRVLGTYNVSSKVLTRFSDGKKFMLKPEHYAALKKMVDPKVDMANLINVYKNYDKSSRAW